MGGDSERQRLIRRYEGWHTLRETALKNAAGGEVPPGLLVEYPSPPPIDEEDFVELSIDLSEAIDPRDALDESGIERTPMADPGVADEPGSPLGSGAHMRRRSVLPGKIEMMRYEACE